MIEMDVCLSGSGVRFPAFAGALEVIEQKGIRIRKVVGNSGGSLVGGLFKCGIPASEIVRISLETDFTKFGKFTFWRFLKAILFTNCMNHGGKFEKYLRAITNNLSFGQVPGLSIITTDLTKGCRKVFSAESDPTYSIARAIRTSCAVPIVWKPVAYKDSLLVDGGVRYDFGVDLLPPDGRPVVGIRTAPKTHMPRGTKALDMLSYLIENLVDATDEKVIEDAPHVKIVDIDTGDVQTNDYNLGLAQKQNLVERGRQAMRNFLRDEFLI